MDIWAKTKRNICALNSGFGAAVRISLRRFFKRIFRKKKERKSRRKTVLGCSIIDWLLCG